MSKIWGLTFALGLLAGACDSGDDPPTPATTSPASAATYQLPPEDLCATLEGAFGINTSQMTRYDSPGVGHPTRDRTCTFKARKAGPLAGENVAPARGAETAITVYLAVSTEDRQAEPPLPLEPTDVPFSGAETAPLSGWWDDGYRAEATDTTPGNNVTIVRLHLYDRIVDDNLSAWVRIDEGYFLEEDLDAAQERLRTISGRILEHVRSATEVQ